MSSEDFECTRVEPLLMSFVHKNMQNFLSNMKTKKSFNKNL